MAFSVRVPVTGVQNCTLLPSAWKYWSLKPLSSLGVSMVVGGEPTGMLRFQVERSIMVLAFYRG